MLEILRSPLIAITDEGVAVAVDVPVAALRPEHGAALPLEAVVLDGTLMPVADDFLFRGRAGGTFKHTCDRCLAEAEAPFEVEVTWTFEEGPPLGPFDGLAEENTGTPDSVTGLHRYQSGVIDLNAPLWEELEFAVPDKFLCGPDCLGLCPLCGGNKNERICGCESRNEELEPKNTGLAGLADMFPDLPTENPKE